MSMSANLHGANRAETGNNGATAWINMYNDDGGKVTIFMPLETAQAMVDAFNGRVAALETALDQISERHIPDQPATDAGSELSWTQRQYAELRKIAIAARTTPAPQEAAE